MSNEKISIEIPAPPEGWVADGYRRAKAGELFLVSDFWYKNAGGTVTLNHYPCAVRAQEPRELVRFYVYKDNTRRMHCEDDCGNILMMDDSPPDYCGLDDIILGGFDRDSGRVAEFHPHLMIRSDGKGGWVAESWTHTSKSHCVDDIYPCDRNGNPLEDKPPVEGWVREGDYWLARIEWGNHTPVFGRRGARASCLADVTDGYRCVGFLRMDQLDVWKQEMSDLSAMFCAAKPCPCLLDWQATHAVMQKEEG